MNHGSAGLVERLIATFHDPLSLSFIISLCEGSPISDDILCKFLSSLQPSGMS